MEEYRNQVIKLHATYSQIISKFTSTISRNTSKFTSKTDQIRLGGGHGGAYPLYKSLSQAVFSPRGAKALVGLVALVDFLAGRRGWVYGDS